MCGIPIEKRTYTTRLSPDEVRQKIAEMVDPTMSWQFLISPKYRHHFYGKLSASAFRLLPILKGGTSPALPVFIGKISQDHEQTTIHLTVRLHWGSLIILCFFMLGGIMFIVEGIITHNIAPSIVGAAFTLVIAFLFVISFKSVALSRIMYFDRLFSLR